MMTLRLATLLAFTFGLTSMTGQQPTGHAAMAMGFDLEKTTHHFLLFTDGGAIDISIKDAKDQANLQSIRGHLPHITQMFGQGDFSAPMLVHDRQDVPGTSTMTALKDRLRYQYVETAKGGRVDISTSDPAALAALHDFLRFQITDHRTGDPLTARRR